MQPSGDHIQHLHQALLDAFDYTGLRAMLRTRLDANWVGGKAPGSATEWESQR